MGIVSRLRKKAHSISESMGILGEFLSFLWEKKLLWMIPIFVFLIVIGSLIIFAQSSALSPFVYTLI